MQQEVAEMNRVNWTAVAVFGVVVLIALVVGLSLLGGGRGYGGWGMMGPGMMGGWGYSPFGWLGMAFMWLIPIGLIVLTALGVTYLVRAVGSGSGNPPALARTCPSCGRAVQLDWRNCPHCGASLAEA
jgi:uncharacterized membrane protein